MPFCWFFHDAAHLFFFSVYIFVMYRPYSVVVLVNFADIMQLQLLLMFMDKKVLHVYAKGCVNTFEKYHVLFEQNLWKIWK